MKKKKSTHKGSPKGAQILWDRAQKVQKEWAREMLDESEITKPLAAPPLPLNPLSALLLENPKTTRLSNEVNAPGMLQNRSELKEVDRKMLKKDPDIFKAFFENKDNASDKEIIKLFPLSSKEL